MRQKSSCLIWYVHSLSDKSNVAAMLVGAEKWLLWGYVNLSHLVCFKAGLNASFGDHVSGKQTMIDGQQIHWTGLYLRMISQTSVTTY